MLSSVLNNPDYTLTPSAGVVKGTAFIGHVIKSVHYVIITSKNGTDDEIQSDVDEFGAGEEEDCPDDQVSLPLP